MEVYINGEWGTVCGWSWDPLDSKVVCQQLGYKGVNRTYSDTGQHNFGEGTGQSWLRDLRCTGSEANLLQCPHDGVGSGCPHSYDVGVVCTNEDLPGEGEWMWVSRRGFQCKSYSVKKQCISVSKGLLHLQTYQTINVRWGPTAEIKRVSCAHMT